MFSDEIMIKIKVPNCPLQEVCILYDEGEKQTTCEIKIVTAFLSIDSVVLQNW